MKKSKAAAKEERENAKATIRLVQETEPVRQETEEPDEEAMEELRQALLQKMKELEETENLVDDDIILARLRAIDRASRPTLWDRITGAYKRKQYGRKLTEREKGLMYYLMMSRIHPVR